MSGRQPSIEALLDCAAQTPEGHAMNQQVEKRRKLLDAVLDLVDEGGIQAVRMKAVADRSGVALGTAYRYFSSKDHLLAEALVEWYQPRLERPDQNKFGADSPDFAAELIARSMQQTIAAFQRRPNFLPLLLAVISSSDPDAVAAYSRMRELNTGAMLHLLRDLDEESRTVVVAAVQYMQLSAVLSLATGRIAHRELTDFTNAVATILVSGAKAVGH